ncbi:MAG: hypothetical protein COB20_00725 [SAR86 cluster bacterium]|uniref:Uncharacterized protein n=1 Tax=SAR86 cluster bacterium TaxID=2030880 RepID=A0A2A4XHZ2_9GAMM|nr:MAG: hypothetical protein COB20_00725 [SAR86 cluster bacterium]
MTGFSLFAGVAAKAHKREKTERLFRHIARPLVSEKWPSLTATDKVCYELKTPCRNDTTQSNEEKGGKSWSRNLGTRIAG